MIKTKGKKGKFVFKFFLGFITYNSLQSLTYFFISFIF